jgi:hypothetical protein
VTAQFRSAITLVRVGGQLVVAGRWCCWRPLAPRPALRQNLAQRLNVQAACTPLCKPTKDLSNSNYWRVLPERVETCRLLAERGDDNGLTLHRIVSGFVIQGGDQTENDE